MQLSDDDSAKWDEFVEWSKRFAEWDGPEQNEDADKLNFAKSLQAARAAVLADDPEWSQLLAKALTSSENNLVSLVSTRRFVAWCDSDPASAREALLGLWEKAGSAGSARLSRFDALVPGTVLKGAEVLSMGSVLLMTVDPLSFPPCQRTIFEQAFRLAGFPVPRKDAEASRFYGEVLAFLDRYRDEARSRELEIPHRRRAQGIIWTMLHSKPEQQPIASWDPADRQALEQFRARSTGKRKVASPAAP